MSRNRTWWMGNFYWRRIPDYATVKLCPPLPSSGTQRIVATYHRHLPSEEEALLRNTSDNRYSEVDTPTGVAEPSCFLLPRILILNTG
jgi:hypothetical protein